MISPSCRLFAVLFAAPAFALAAPPVPLHAQAQAPAEQLAAASALYDAGKFAPAAKLLDAFLAANPNHPRVGAAALALGRCRSELGQYAKAVPAYEKAIASKDPKIKNTAELGLGEAALQTSQWAKAAGALKAATAAGVTPAQAPVAYDWLGQAEYQLGQYAAAAEAYNEVVSKYPESEAAADATFGAGLSALKLGRTDEAHQRLRAVVDRDPKSENRPQALLLLGQMDLDAKQYGQARDEFQNVLSAVGADADTKGAAEDGLVNALLKLGDYAGAATRLQAILGPPACCGPAALPRRTHSGPLPVRAEAVRARPGCLHRCGQVAGRQSRGSGIVLVRQLRPRPETLDGGRRAFRVRRVPFPRLGTGGQSEGQSRGCEGGGAGGQRGRSAPAGAAGPGCQEVRPGGGGADTPACDHSARRCGGGGALPAWPGGSGPRQDRPCRRRADRRRSRRDGDGLAARCPCPTGLAEPSRASSPPSPEKSARAALALSAKPGYSPAVEQQARLALVQADLDQQKWDDALAGCQMLSASNPPPDVMATVLFTQAWVSEKQGHADAALPLWSRLASEFSGSAYASQALLHLGDGAFKAQKFDDAQARYADLLAKYPRSDEAPQARLGLGQRPLQPGQV